MMYDLLLYNSRIYLKNNVENNYNTLGIRSGKISLLDDINNSDLEYLISNSKQSIDLENKWITPGLIDCHTHLIFAGNRSSEFADRIAGKSYEEITMQGGGINSTVKYTREASFEDLLNLSIDRVNQMLSNGVTTIEVKSGYGLDLDSEIKILRVADWIDKNTPIDIQKTFLGAHLMPKEYSSKNKYINFLSEVILPKLYQEQLVDAVDGFCENIAFTADELRVLFNKAQEYNLPIKCHTEQLSNIGGGELVCQYGDLALSCDHLEYSSENVIKLMSEFNISPVLLPGAYYYLNEQQKPPIDYIRKYNLPIAIATDFNPGTSPVISIINIMNMACVLYKLTTKEVWDAVTINAAKALGMDKTIGSIELDKQADLVIWDFNHLDEACYYMGMDWNKTVIKNGEILIINI